MRGRCEIVVKWSAVALGLTNAAVTAYWLVGGTALLSTIGGEIEAWGRRRSAAVLVALVIVLLVKLAVAVVPLMRGRLPRVLPSRLGRIVGWGAATVLTSYGALLTVVGLLVQLGVVERSAGANDTALAWHAYLWDPWFLAWGIALAWWLRLSNRTAPGDLHASTDR